MISIENRDVLSARQNEIKSERKPAFGEFELKIGPEMTLPKEIAQAFEGFLNGDFIRAHREVSQPHPTHFQKKFGIPSPIVRIDASSMVDPKHPERSIFEVEARPAGLGILGILGAIQPIKEVFDRVSKVTQKKLAFGVLPSVLGQDGGHDRSIDTRMAAEAIGVPYLERPW